jgi:hypothetical protein
MELFQSNTSTKSRPTIRFKNHILKQLIVDRVLLQLAGNAAQLGQRDRPAGPAREELVCVVDLGD